MNIETLRMFCLVVDIGSISQAAKLSYLSQPAVTKQIRQLEAIYGATLFNRKEGRLSLNENGETLYPIAKSIVSDFKHSKEAVLDNIRNSDLQLKVGASFTIGEYLLPKLLGKFKKLHTDTKITLIVENTPNVLEALSNDVIDLALVEGIVGNNNFNVEPIEEDQLVLIHPLDHKWTTRTEIDINELSQEKMIWREPTSGTRLIIENLLKGQGILDKIENYMELGSTQAIKSAVEAGLGISIVSRLAVERDLDQNIFREIKIKDTYFKRNLWLVRKNSRFCRKSVEDFISLLKNIETT
ncbi:LysR family transcriptional regulator [Virgibacillus dakarensis]|uniref:LysR family transcriptional regulator n=1 Tax=Lentibacillus populi TaxID=1827502 RepID=A0A9W5X426_9BACI|nr:LysR family transcriptional regulator [Lentibacillus populi]MTW87206.1 LysR family transcriptional regulator [Virgibacillus dakarensis]GGB31891.1 LysR family transcriptional regulator [Lentibacillus populi]